MQIECDISGPILHYLNLLFFNKQFEKKMSCFVPLPLTEIEQSNTTSSILYLAIFLSHLYNMYKCYLFTYLSKKTNTQRLD